jgi:anti-sigma factor RsiW
MSDFRDIWTAGEGGSGKLTEEQLMAYLEGRLSEEERHEVEALLAAEGMESDALEGLQNLSADDARDMRRSLNSQLQRSLAIKRRKRRGLASQHWNVVAVVVLLLLILICFVIFRIMRHR